MILALQMSLVYVVKVVVDMRETAINIVNLCSRLYTTYAAVKVDIFYSQQQAHICRHLH